MFGTDLIETKISPKLLLWHFHNYPRKIYTIQFNIYNDENYYFKTRIDGLVLGKSEDKAKGEEESGERVKNNKNTIATSPTNDKARENILGLMDSFIEQITTIRKILLGVSISALLFAILALFY